MNTATMARKPLLKVPDAGAKRQPACKFIAPADRITTMPEGIPKLTLGWGAIRWATKYLKQPDGDNAGDRWRFTESQVRFILWWYAIEPDGKGGVRWVYNHGVRRLPKGSGKSPFAAVMALMELLAPVRFLKWDDTKRGGCVGKRVPMPLVQIAGVAESSAMINTMRMVSALVPKNSRLEEDYDLEKGKTLIYVPGGGQLHIITNSAAANEGALATFAVMDQTEAFKKANGGIDLASTIRRNLRKTKNRGLETSNAWEPGKDSVAETTFGAWCAEEEKRTRGRSKTLMDIRMAPLGTDVHGDIGKLIKAVQFAYGDCYWADAEDIVMNGILDPKTPLSESLRFYLNWPTVPEDAWSDPNDWAVMRDEDFYIPFQDDIVIGFDGSRTNDATAVIGCHVETGYIFVIGIWTPVKATRETTGVPIPVREVDAAIAQAFEDFNVVAFWADVREWESFTKVTWPDQYGERLSTWAVPGGKDPQCIAWDMRVHVGQFTRAAELTLTEIEEHAFRHDGDYRLRKHVANARDYKTNYGTSISKESPDSDNKIDGTAAMIIAREARRLTLSNPEYVPGTRGKKASGKQAGNVWSR